jgi:16S rRNA (uracil1498-N3)-methyltransferase
MRRFLHHPLPDRGEVLLTEAASHHLLQVAKLPRGTTLGLFDGRGREVEAELIDVENGRARVRLSGPLEEARPPHVIHLVLAVLKGDAMAHGLRMATEAGVTHVWPTVTARTIAKGDRGDRWRRILHSAAQQCGRADLPELAPVRPLAEQLLQLPNGITRFVAAPGGQPAPAPHGPSAVAIGPEGGWTDAELHELHRQGWTQLGLGRWILRADTAVAVAVSSLA